MKSKILKLAILIVLAVLVYQFGVKPIMGRDYYVEKSRNDNNWAGGKLSKEAGRYDVIVVGEEPEGIAAAVSSSRTGARTLLLSLGGDLGGSNCSGLYFDTEINHGAEGDVLNRGLFSEITGRLGDTVTVQKYKSVMKSLVEGEKNLEVIYGAGIDSPVLDGNVLTGINVSVQGKKSLVRGKRIIDATHDGVLLNMCGVPYTVGMEDIGLKGVFQPLIFNFILSSVKWSEVEALFKDGNQNKLNSIIRDFKAADPKIRLANLKFFPQDGDKVIVRGIEAYGVDLEDKDSVSKAYNASVEEARRLALILKDRLIAFQASSFDCAADNFYIKEYRHFGGEHYLNVNEALENTDFPDKISMASNHIEIATHNSGYLKYVIGKPSQYAIPLGCLVPLKVDNLLMVGGKISYSSLVSSSANSMGVNITTGESAGVAAVHTLINNITPRQLLKGSNVEKINELERLLKRQGIYLPSFEIKNPNTGSWAYTSVRQLNTLGLVSSGYKNNYKFNSEATQNDLSILLLNGIYRLSRDKYTLKLDTGMRAYFIEKGLTKDKAAEILLALNGVPNKQDNAFEKACEMGLINNAMRLRLRDQRILTMDQVYELSVHNITLFCAKPIKDFTFLH